MKPTENGAYEDHTKADDYGNGEIPCSTGDCRRAHLPARVPVEARRRALQIVSRSVNAWPLPRQCLWRVQDAFDCPIAKGAELLGDRWTLLIIRELLLGPVRFNEFERGLPGISRSVLASRLRRLERDGIIERAGNGEGYSFTSVGESLRPVIRTIGDWVANWVIEDPRRAELDAELLMLFISRHVKQEELPAGKTVLRFEFEDDARRFWLTMERQGVSVCLEDPCLPVAVKVRAQVHQLYRVYMGRTSLLEALGDGSVELEGLPADRRRFEAWMKWSSFAPAVRTAVATRR